jgi:transposase
LIKMEEFMDIFNLKKQGLSISAIAREMQLDRKTVRKYLKQGPSKPPTRPSSRKRSSLLDPYKDEIKLLLQRASEENGEFLSAVFIHRHISRNGFSGSVSLVRKYLHKTQSNPFSKLIPIFETIPGQQAQVDWGEKLIPSETGGKKKVYMFCMTLSHSGIRFVTFFPKANRYYFLLGHIRSFHYFHGVPETVLYDQTRCAIDKPGFGKVKWNDTFYEFARYYGFQPKACLPYRAQTKGKVENLVKYTKKNFLPLKRFISFDVLNAEARRWLAEVNKQVHSRTGMVPFDMLYEEEISKLQPMPRKDYEIYELETRKVYLTSTISFKSKRYSVPPSLLGKQVTIKYRPEKQVFQVFYRDLHICTHELSYRKGKYVILKEHQEEISRIMRESFKLMKRRKHTGCDSDPFEGIKRSLSVYEEVGR